MKKNKTLITAACACGLLMACGDKNEATSQCVSLEAGDGCAGVAETSLGSGDYYTDSTGAVNCSEIVYVRSGASGGSGTESAPFGDLPEAASVAGPGSCIALAAGSYSGAALPDSVSVLGRGSQKTTITGSGNAALTITGGSGVLIRGVRLTGDDVGVKLSNASELTLESVLVEDTRRSGVDITDATGISLLQVHIAGVVPATGALEDVGVGLVSQNSSAISVTLSLIEGCQGSGLVHFGQGLSVERSVVRNNTAYGIAAACEGSCTLAPEISITQCLVVDNEGVGVWLDRVVADIAGSTIRGTLRNAFGMSRAIEAADLEDIVMTDNILEGGAGLGVLLHASNGLLEGNVISGHGGRGIWIQNTEDATSMVVVDVNDNQVLDNHQVGVGVLGECDVVLQGGSIAGTVLDSVFTDTGNIEQGDGVQALVDSTVSINEVTFVANDRKSILADSVVHLTVGNSSFDNADADPIAVQNIGVSNIDEATNIDVSANTSPEGGSIAPTMPIDPWGLDASEVGTTMVAL